MRKDALTHDQQVLALFLASNGAGTESLDRQLDLFNVRYRRAANIMGLVADKMTEEQIQGDAQKAKDPVTDEQKLEYLSMLNKDSDSFSSLSAIMDRLNSLHPKPTQ